MNGSVLSVAPLATEQASSPQQRWSLEKANRWYAGLPWLVGANYIPATASNQLEMWQAETFDPARIELELGWAENLGMNVMRVFLHDLLWQQDPQGFRERIDQFLDIAWRHGIRTLFVLFDSCWHPLPKLGLQAAPSKGVHNSGWVQGPGCDGLRDLAQHARLEQYVTGVVGAFANAPRVLGWDVWNEPDNENTASYASLEPKDKLKLVDALLPKVFEWARAAHPSQPLTSGLWIGDWSQHANFTSIQRTQIDQSDVLSFHNYESAEEFEKRLEWLAPYGRPLLCTEYMARCSKSTFDAILPVAKKHRVAAINWGLVAGKTQTYLPWDSWAKPYVSTEPEMWFHEVLRPDGAPYCEAETQLIQDLTKPRAMRAGA